MRLRFTIPASRQLESVLGYIAERDPRAADRVLRRLQVLMQVVLDHPQAGLLTTRRGMRRLVASPYPYVIICRVGEQEIVVHSVRHTSRRPR